MCLINKTKNYCIQLGYKGNVINWCVFMVQDSNV
jgi:hypothetical protein